MAVENERYSVYNFRKGKARGAFCYLQFMIECREIWNNNLKSKGKAEFRTRVIPIKIPLNEENVR